MTSNTKVYVSVVCDFRNDGLMLPKELTWENGKKYRIDRVIKICPTAALKSGGKGERYTVQIKGQQSYLFFEQNDALFSDNIGRWYVLPRPT